MDSYIPDLEDPATLGLLEDKLRTAAAKVNFIDDPLCISHYRTGTVDISWYQPFLVFPASSCSRKEAYPKVLLQLWNDLDIQDKGGRGFETLVGAPQPARAKIFHLSRGTPRDAVPAGAVLVLKDLDPRLCNHAEKAVAVITEIGSSEAHFSMVALERGISILKVPRARDFLEDGTMMRITQNAVYPEKETPRLYTACKKCGDEAPKRTNGLCPVCFEKRAEA
jgi:phosphohistidine swiveling domain-containing protein